MKPLPKHLLIGGLLLCFGAPFIGLLVTVVGVIGAFHALGQDGISDPHALSAHIGTALVATAVGIFVGIMGIALVIVAAIVHFLTRPASTSL